MTGSYRLAWTIQHQPAVLRTWAADLGRGRRRFRFATPSPTLPTSQTPVTRGVAGAAAVCPRPLAAAARQRGRPDHVELGAMHELRARGGLNPAASGKPVGLRPPRRWWWTAAQRGTPNAR